MTMRALLEAIGEKHPEKKGYGKRAVRKKGSKKIRRRVTKQEIRQQAEAGEARYVVIEAFAQQRAIDAVREVVAQGVAAMQRELSDWGAEVVQALQLQSNRKRTGIQWALGFATLDPDLTGAVQIRMTLPQGAAVTAATGGKMRELVAVKAHVDARTITMQNDQSWHVWTYTIPVDYTEEDI